MSGSVGVSGENGWCKAGWCYRAILREIIIELRTADAPADMLLLLEDPNGSAQAAEHVELADMPLQWQRLFAIAASSAYQRCRAHGFSVSIRNIAIPPILAAWRELVSEMRELYDHSPQNA